MEPTKEQKGSFLQSVKLFESLEESYRQKTTFEEKFSALLNKDFEKMIEFLDFKGAKNKEDKYRAKKAREYRELGLLLLSNEMFVKQIKHLAKKWGLDKDKYEMDLCGFYEYPIPFAINLWENRLISRSFGLRIKHTKEIKAAKQKAIKQYLKDCDFIELKNEFSRIDFSWLLIEKFKKEIKDLLLTYNLDDIWEHSIVGLLLSGKLILPVKYCQGIIQYDDENRPVLSIELTPHTTLEDIEHKWGNIERLKDQLYPLRKKRYKTTKNIEQIIKLGGDSGKRWELVEEKYGDRSKERRLKMIEALRKAEKRLTEKQEEETKRGSKRKIALPLPLIKEFEDRFGKLRKSYFI